VLLEAGGGIPCRPNPAATLLVSIRHKSLENSLTATKRYNGLNLQFTTAYVMYQLINEFGDKC